MLLVGKASVLSEIGTRDANTFMPCWPQAVGYYSQLHPSFSDSTVLAYVLKTLNQKYNYGLNLILLSVDEGITGYRDDSLEVNSYNAGKESC